MKSELALGLAVALIVWLFRRDKRLRTLPSKALWIPAVWLAIIASRPVSQWLAVIGIHVGGANDVEGSPVDAVVFFVLMVSSVVVLVRRDFDWTAFVRRNKVLIVIYLYLVLSVLWSEIGFPTLKRAVKDFGHVLVVLVLLSEANPLKAIRIVYVRLSYLLFPLSLVFCKFFPRIGRMEGRGFENMYMGVTLHKSQLGITVFVFGLFLMVDLMEMRQGEDGSEKTDQWIRYGLLAMGAWLLYICNSVTGVICLTLAGLLLWGTGRLLRMQDPKKILFRCLAVIACAATLQFAFNISTTIIHALGRNDTLTGRTVIWEQVLNAHTNPILGCGFYSFWDTKAGQAIAVGYDGTLRSAHNGLLAMYLDEGGVGLGLLILLLLIWGRRSIQQMLEGTVRGRVMLTYWLLAIMYNFSEEGYFRFTPIWFTLLLLMIECPPCRYSRALQDRTASELDLQTV